MRNKDRHVENQAILTGRHAGAFFLNGEPRGGGNRCVTTENFTLYEATYAGIGEVCDVLGLNEDGTRTPYNELHAQVKPVSITRRTIYDQRGAPVSVETQRGG